MPINIWGRVVKSLCVVPAIFSAIQHNILGHTRSLYSKTIFSNVQFKTLAYATEDCEFKGVCRIWEHSILSSVKMGIHTYCGSGCVITHSVIGNFCSIGNEAIIGTWMHPTHLVSTFPGFYAKGKHTFNIRCDDEVMEFQHVNIGNDVWIGHRVIILGGITVGDGAIIGAGAVVTKDVEPYAVVAGVPARMLRKRFKQSTIDSLLEIRWWEYDEDILRKYSDLFGDPDAFIEKFRK